MFRFLILFSLFFWSVALNGQRSLGAERSEILSFYSPENIKEEFQDKVYYTDSSLTKLTWVNKEAQYEIEFFFEIYDEFYSLVEADSIEYQDSLYNAECDSIVYRISCSSCAGYFIDEILKYAPNGRFRKLDANTYLGSKWSTKTSSPWLPKKERNTLFTVPTIEIFDNTEVDGSVMVFIFNKTYTAQEFKQAKKQSTKRKHLDYSWRYYEKCLE